MVKFCDQCGTRCQDEMVSCPTCGTSFAEMRVMLPSAPIAPPPKTGPSTTTIAAIAAVILIGVVAVGLLVASSSSDGGSSGSYSRPPNPEVLSERADFDGWTPTVTVTVRNNGGSGAIRIIAEMQYSSSREKKDVVLHFNGGESKTHTFHFTEVNPNIWGGRYDVRAEVA